VFGDFQRTVSYQNQTLIFQLNGYCLRNHYHVTVLFNLEGSREPDNNFFKGEFKMKMPSTISGWCMFLFFLWFGLAQFVALPLEETITGILALGYAVLSFIGQ